MADAADCCGVFCVFCACFAFCGKACFYWPCCRDSRGYNSKEDEEFAREVEMETRAARAQGLPDSAVYNPLAYNQSQPAPQAMQLPAPQPVDGFVVLLIETPVDPDPSTRSSRRRLAILFEIVATSIEPFWTLDAYGGTCLRLLEGRALFVSFRGAIAGEIGHHPPQMEIQWTSYHDSEAAQREVMAKEAELWRKDPEDASAAQQHSDSITRQPVWQEQARPAPPSMQIPTVGAKDRTSLSESTGKEEDKPPTPVPKDS
ncbi:hypothetical protein CVT26_001920 [Gymnopilus dilepis]|uniref:Velvet domain-containing protein n=1 Tax=Gymnopilus dilepis TaxID=231916 RepID=A0A409Y402_9AGAR|nr:hypothetical protein CVT26_001920 [Gymnopilus dilepis]